MGGDSGREGEPVEVNAFVSENRLVGGWGGKTSAKSAIRRNGMDLNAV